MDYKFKVGDRVRVSTRLKHSSAKINDVGIIKQRHLFWRDYFIEFDRLDTNNRPYCSWIPESNLKLENLLMKC